MTGDMVADLLADLLDPAGGAWPAPTPAKAANPANREHPCRPASDSLICEGLRIAANLERGQSLVAQDSQTFAALRNLPDGLESEQRRGVSQHSQDSQRPPEGKAPGKATERPYRLTAAAADRCHAPEWQDADIARFTARVQRFARLGIGTEDADDLAERLTLRDRDADDRVMCAECTHYRPGRCGMRKAAGLDSPELCRDLAMRLQRCPAFKTSG